MIKFSKTRDVKSPVRGDSLASGIDFFVPKFDKEFEGMFKSLKQNKKKEVCFDPKGDYIPLEPNEGILIPLGIKVNIPKGYDLVFQNKSGVASKYGLLVGSCVIDENYEGELLLNLWNVSKEKFRVEPGFKAIQGVIREVNLMGLKEVNLESLFRGQVSERGEGGFGSTGTK